MGSDVGVYYQIKPVMVLSNINCTFAFKFKNWKWVKMFEFYFISGHMGAGSNAAIAAAASQAIAATQQVVRVNVYRPIS